MRERQIVETLDAIGLARVEYRLLRVLPLVQVAWSDGSIHPDEARTIRRHAHEAGLTSTKELAVINAWLRAEPTDEQYRRALRVLVHLTHFYQGVDPHFDTRVLDSVKKGCLEVARAAGGVWGMGRISKREREALAEIERAIELHAAQANHDVRNNGGVGWNTLEEQLDRTLDRALQA